jgi:uncharacterized membrane protein
MAQTYNTQLNNVLAKFSTLLNISVTQVWLRDALLSHPDYPSLFSISETLKKLSVETLATKVNAEHLDELPVPFITYLKGLPTGKDFVLVTKHSTENVQYIYDGNKTVSITRDEFLKKWEHIVLLAEAGAYSGQADYEAELKKEKEGKHSRYAITAGWLSVLAILAGSIITGATELLMPFVLLLFTKLVGVGITVLLLWYETDKTNPFVKSICTAGAKTNCDAVLSSKASRFMGMSWSEVGFFYFAGSLLFLLFPGLQLSVKLPWLALEATIVVPYVIFSLYYQYRVVKQWCPMCLATQAVITIEFIIAALCYFNEAMVLSFSFSIIATALVAVLVPILGWFVLKPFLAHTKNADHYEYAYKRILYNPEYFKLLLEKQPTIPDGWQNLGITIGNPEAENTIIKVCNPYCGPCRKAHPILDEIISKYNIKIQIIFYVDEDEPELIVTQHLLAINAELNQAKTMAALHDWYLAPTKNFDAFSKKYPVSVELNKYTSNIKEMNSWCIESEVKETPTFFINKSKFPNEYLVKDLAYLIENTLYKI